MHKHQFTVGMVVLVLCLAVCSGGRDRLLLLHGSLARMMVAGLLIVFMGGCLMMVSDVHQHDADDRQLGDELRASRSHDGCCVYGWVLSICFSYITVDQTSRAYRSNRARLQIIDAYDGNFELSRSHAQQVNIGTH